MTAALYYVTGYYSLYSTNHYLKYLAYLFFLRAVYPCPPPPPAHPPHPRLPANVSSTKAGTFSSRHPQCLERCLIHSRSSVTIGRMDIPNGPGGPQTLPRGPELNLGFLAMLRTLQRRSARVAAAVDQQTRDWEGPRRSLGCLPPQTQSWSLLTLGSLRSWLIPAEGDDRSNE